VRLKPADDRTDAVALTGALYQPRETSHTPSQAQWGVLILDEVDKLRRRDTQGVDVGGEGAQRSLLSLLDGGSVQMEWPPTGPRESRTWCPFPCGRLMIILAGAFSGLADVVVGRIGRKRRIGFGGGSELASRGDYELLQQVTPGDLVTFGMIPEFAARLNIVVMHDLSRDALREILLNAKEGPFAVQQRMAQRERFRLKLTDELVDAVVDEAMAQGLGARSLHARLAEITRMAFYEMPSKINPLDNGTFTVELGMEALVDGRYELTYRRHKRSAAEQRKLVKDVRRRPCGTGDDAAEAASG